MTMVSTKVLRSTDSIKLDDVLRESREVFGRPVHESPKDWSDEVLYFLLPDRFSDDSAGQMYDSTNSTQRENALRASDPNDTDAAAAGRWQEAGTLFVGGTIKGIQRRLSYLEGMGVTAIWIGPMFKQSVWDQHAYHGYGIQNFLDIDKNFGTREDLRELVKEAHGKNLRVILDIVLNHSADTFAYEASDAPWDGSKEYDVKCWRGPSFDSEVTFGSQPLNADLDTAVWPSELQQSGGYTRKGYIKNFDNPPEYWEGDFFGYKDINLGQNNISNFEETDSIKALCTVYKYWISYADIDGFRIDTVKHMGRGPTKYFCSQIHEYTKSVGKENFLLVGEVTGGRFQAFNTVRDTGLDAALGIGQTPDLNYRDDVQDHLEYLPKGFRNPQDFFKIFSNSPDFTDDSHAWFRNRVLTMLDDHDQIRKGNMKARFCANDNGTPSSVLSALGFNLCTLGIPCIYYGTEQSFDGRGFDDSGKQPFNDRWIRESMFGGNFGAFRTKDLHFFDDQGSVYQGVQDICRVRKAIPALRQGLQYLREISSADDGNNFGFPTKYDGGQMTSIVPWSRILDGVEVLCAINTDAEHEITAWVTVDRGLHGDGDDLSRLYPKGGKVKIEGRDGRAVVRVTVGAGGFVLYQ